jgi:hypothetical protein
MKREREGSGYASGSTPKCHGSATLVPLPHGSCSTGRCGTPWMEKWTAEAMVTEPILLWTAVRSTLRQCCGIQILIRFPSFRFVSDPTLLIETEHKKITYFLKYSDYIPSQEFSNNYLCTCDLYTPVHNVLEAWIYITWGSWRGLGPGIP